MGARTDSFFGIFTPLALLSVWWVLTNEIRFPCPKSLSIVDTTSIVNRLPTTYGKYYVVSTSPGSLPGVCII